MLYKGLNNTNKNNGIKFYWLSKAVGPKYIMYVEVAFITNSTVPVNNICPNLAIKNILVLVGCTF